MSKKDEALKLALEALEGCTAAHDLTWKPRLQAITAIREALAEQPAQTLPFGVGGGLVAIKTLLNRDPCAHAKVAIEMIDSMLTEQPAPPPECQTEAEKTAFAFGWWKALESVRQPSEPWVGLTDEEVDECYYWKDRLWTTDELVRHVEAKLREKNGGAA